MKWKTNVIVFTLVFLMSSNAWTQNDMQAVTEPVKVFESGYIQVIGVSEEGQSRYKALRAAQVVAQRDLLETLEGLNLHGSTSVKDGMLQSDQIDTMVRGYLRGAIKCGQNFNSDKGYAEVCMRLHIRGKGGLWDLVLPLIKDQAAVAPEKKPDYKPDFKEPVNKPGIVPQVVSPGQQTGAATPATPSGAGNAAQATAQTTANQVQAPSQLAKPYDGLIIDARDFKFRPALVNRVLSESEEVVFEPSRIQSNILVERGCGGFTTDDGKARALLESWGSKNPMVVKCMDVHKFTDAKISKDDAAAIYVNDQKSNILAHARVVFLLK